jgi:hypothetical protein
MPDQVMRIHKSALDRLYAVEEAARALIHEIDNGPSDRGMALLFDLEDSLRSALASAQKDEGGERC